MTEEQKTIESVKRGRGRHKKDCQCKWCMSKKADNPSQAPTQSEMPEPKTPVQTMQNDVASAKTDA